MDDIERAAIAAEGYDPNPVVVAALACVSAVLAELGPLVWEASAVLDEPSDSREELLRALEKCARHRFSDWPVPEVPNIAAGGYTIRDQDRVIYVGMAGRGLAAENIDAPDEPVKAKGLPKRLSSHATGRRSGDQFCVYVRDRFIVPSLSREQQGEVADGQLSLDALTRQLIRDRYEFCFVTTSDGGVGAYRHSRPHGCRTSSADGGTYCVKNSRDRRQSGRPGFYVATVAIPHGVRA